MPRKVRNYKEEYKYQGTEEQKKNRATRGRARYALEKKVGAAALKGKDVDHRKPLSKGGSNATSNLRIQSKSANRSYPRNSKGGVK